jgi:hypothetical protein
LNDRTARLERFGGRRLVARQEEVALHELNDANAQVIPARTVEIKQSELEVGEARR